MTHTALLKAFKVLSHGQRMRRMVELGRAASRNVSIQAVLAKLHQGGVYERCLAVQAAYGSRDAERVLAALQDPSCLVRSCALKLVAEVCDDAQVRRALEFDLPRGMTRVLVRTLAQRRRYAPIDDQLTRWAEQGDPRADRLLAYASPAYRQRRLPLALAQGLELTSLVRMARRDGAAVATVLTDNVRKSPDYDARLFVAVRSTLSLIAESHPKQALALVTALEPGYSLAQLPLDILIRRLPQEVADLALRHRDQVALDFGPVAQRLDGARLSQILLERSAWLPLSPTWFRKLSPATRGNIYRQFHNGWRDEHGALPAWLLEYLAAADRTREARLHFRNPALANRALDQANYAACMSWDGALAALEPLLRSTEGEQRGAALRALVGTVRFERQRAGELLQLLLARKHEQDPVRLAFLQALLALPTVVWQEPHLEALGGVLRQALDAADISPASAMAAQQLVVRLLPTHSAWAIAWLVTLVKERGQVYLSQLETQITNDDMRRMVPILLPVLKAWNTRERQQQLLSLAASLGRRVRVFPELLAILVEIAKNATGWAAAQALAVIYQHAHPTFGPLVPQLLASDPSWITNHLVYNHLHRHRQDLLDAGFLGRKAYRGKFSTGKTRFVLPLLTGFGRWTPEQQMVFSQTLEEVTRDHERDVPAKLQALQQLAALPEMASPRVLQLAAVQNKQLIVRDTALRALARFDGGQGVPVLLSAITDDRARIAIYALRQALLSMPVSRALELLRQVAIDKVTVAKEVVRLIGELPHDEAYNELLAWNRRELHRDVRVALLRACWDHLHRDATWQVLEQAALSPDAAVAKMVGRIPVDGWPETRHVRYTDLLAKLLAHESAGVRCDVLSRLAVMPVVDARQQLLSPLLSALRSPVEDEVRLAAQALLGTYAVRSPHSLATAVQSLLSERRALVVLLRALEERIVWQRGTYRLALAAALDALSPDPLTITLRTRLASVGLVGNDLAAYYQRVQSELQVDALSTACSLLTQARTYCSPEVATFLELEQALSQHDDERLRRLALAALQAQTLGSLGWSAALRARLAEFQRDSSPLVAEAAAFTFPPRELLAE